MAAKKVDRRDEAFAGEIGRHTASKRITQQTFADRVCITRATLNNWMKNPSVVTLGHFRIIVRETNMSDETILAIVKGTR